MKERRRRRRRRRTGGLAGPHRAACVFNNASSLSPPGSVEPQRRLFIAGEQQLTHTLLFTTRSRGKGLASGRGRGDEEKDGKSRVYISCLRVLKGSVS